MNRKSISLVIALYLVLGTWKGYIALFEGDSSEPRQIYPNQVFSLPPCDQKALEEGIIIRSEEKLQQLLEDFLS